MIFGLILDLGLNPDACIRTVEGPPCPWPPPGEAGDIERFAFEKDDQFVTLRTMDCAAAEAAFCGVVCASICVGALAFARAPPCAVDRMSAWLFCLPAPLSALSCRAV